MKIVTKALKQWLIYAIINTLTKIGKKKKKKDITSEVGNHKLACKQYTQKMHQQNFKKFKENNRWTETWKLITRLMLWYNAIIF